MPTGTTRRPGRRRRARCRAAPVRSGASDTVSLAMPSGKIATGSPARSACHAAAKALALAAPPPSWVRRSGIGADHGQDLPQHGDAEQPAAARNRGGAVERVQQDDRVRQGAEVADDPQLRTRARGRPGGPPRRCGTARGRRLGRPGGRAAARAAPARATVRDRRRPHRRRPRPRRRRRGRAVERRTGRPARAQASSAARARDDPGEPADASVRSRARGRGRARPSAATASRAGPLSATSQAESPGRPAHGAALRRRVEVGQDVDRVGPRRGRDGAGDVPQAVPLPPRRRAARRAPRCVRARTPPRRWRRGRRRPSPRRRPRRRPTAPRPARPDRRPRSRRDQRPVVEDVADRSTDTVEGDRPDPGRRR